MIEKNKHYFLSASVPYGERAKNYIPDSIAVRDAVRALVSVVIRDSCLVFGGHPAITPFIWDAAKTLGADDNVMIYQSEFFQDKIPHEVRFFREIYWTDVVKDQTGTPSLDNSLALMREKMIGDNNYSAAIFIGGMDGLEEEWKLFEKYHPDTPKFPLASTEGAARILWNDWNGNYVDIDIKEMLNNELRYRYLFRTILSKPINSKF